MKRDRRHRLLTDGWHSTKSPRKKRRKKAKPRIRRNICRICGGKKAQRIEGAGMVHKSCFLVWYKASGRPVSLETRVRFLTRRQRQMMRLCSLGLGNAEIGLVMGIRRQAVDDMKGIVSKSLDILRSEIPRVAIQFKISPLKDRLTAEECCLCGRNKSD